MSQNHHTISPDGETISDGDPGSPPVSPTGLGDISSASTWSDLSETESHVEDGEEEYFSSQESQPSQVSRLHAGNVKEFLETSLFEKSPLSQDLPDELISASLRVRYEVCRVAIDCKAPLYDLARGTPADFNTPGELWNWLSSKNLQQGRKIVLPPRTTEQAWELAGSGSADDVSHSTYLTGELVFGQRLSEPLFTFCLKPLSTRHSCRFYRRFGSDRFLAVRLPCLEDYALPAHLRDHGEVVREYVARWLVGRPHRIFQRTWRAVFIEKSEGKKGKKEEESENFGEKVDRGKGNGRKVTFFAVKGADLQDRGTRTVEEFVEWFMPFERNKRERCLKAFARIKLGFSDTQSTLQFRPEQVGTVEDIHARGNPEGNVMSDGCAIISQAAAQMVAQRLGINDYLPSAFQGRIGGAKGVWMVSGVDHAFNKGFGNEDFCCIDIRESQSKFVPSADDAHLTLDICDWSKPLRSCSLNKELLLILSDRGVPTEVLVRLLRKGIDEPIRRQMEAMEDPLSFRKWSEEVHPAMKEREANGGVKMIGGLPASHFERINMLLESGFRTETCNELKDHAWTVAKDNIGNCKSLKIPLEKSTRTFCVADYLNVLEPDEVHLSFSSIIKNTELDVRRLVNDGIDVLVARVPARLPSDIQKVRAVFRRELEHLKDIVVFSSKGDVPLAKKLAGGDYDGDKVWIVWESSLVENFTNAEVPDKIQPDEFGITQDAQSWADVAADAANSTSALLLRGFTHNLKANLLGKISKAHERLCADQGSISFPGAIRMAQLLEYLVDAPKHGYDFGKDTWREIEAEIRLDSASRQGNSRESKPNLVEQLVQEAGECAKLALTQFSETYKVRGSMKPDNELKVPWREEKIMSNCDTEVVQVLDNMLREIREVHSFWERGFSPKGVDTATKIECHARYREIMPPQSTHGLVARWRREARRSPICHWVLLRASATYCEFPRNSFVWWMAGRELCHLKAVNLPGSNMVVQPIYLALKPNMAFGKRAARQRIDHVEDTATEVRNATDYGESEFGYDDWVDEALL